MASVVGSRLSRGAATIKPTTALTLTAAIAVAVMLRATMAAAQSGQIQGPDFQVWDLKFGRIGMETDPVWLQHALENGTLGYRDLACKVTQETTTVVYPLPPEVTPESNLPGRYGLTFEYTTTKPNVPYTLVVTYPPDPQGGQRKGVGNGFLPGETTGKTGRFCFSQWSNEPDAQIPGQHCYQMTIEGVPLPEICVDVVNPNYVEPNAR